MANKKTYIVLITIILVFFITMFLLFGVEGINQSNYSSTIIVGNNTLWTYDNMTWTNIQTDYSKGKLNWKEFNVYSSGKSLGKYYLWHDDRWYIFDKEKNAVDIDGLLLAYNANFTIKVLDVKEEEVKDYTYVKKVLASNNLSTSSEFTNISKLKFDFDNDGNDEDFYLMSNAFPIDFEPSSIFSIVFMVKNDTIYYLYKDVSSNTGLNGCKPYWNHVLDTNKDGVYELIVSCGRFGAGDPIDMLFGFDNKEFKLLISSQ